MAKFYVKHPKLNLRVNGKLQLVPVGAEIELSDKASASLLKKGFIEEAGKAPKVAVEEGAPKKKEGK